MLYIRIFHITSFVPVISFPKEILEGGSCWVAFEDSSPISDEQGFREAVPQQLPREPCGSSIGTVGE